MDSSGDPGPKNEEKRRRTILLQNKKINDLNGKKSSSANVTRTGSNTNTDDSNSKKKKVSFNETEPSDTKTFSIDEEIKRKSVDAQRKSFTGKKIVPNTKDVPKEKDVDPSVENLLTVKPSGDLSSRSSDKGRKKSTSDKHKHAVRMSKDVDTKHIEKLTKETKKKSKVDIKKASIEVDRHKNDHDDGHLEGKGKKKSDKKKSMILDPGKKGKKDELKVTKKSIVGLKGVSSKSKKNSPDESKSKKNSPDETEEQKVKRKTDKRVTHSKSLEAHLSSTNKHSHESYKSHEDHDGKHKHGENDDEEEEHHHHAHHHHHHHHDSKERKKVSFTESPNGHFYLHIANSSDPDTHTHHHHDHHHDPHHHDPHHHDPHHPHHHHHSPPKDTKHHNIIFNVHKTREQRTWVAEMRGYTSEPVLPLPFDKKFTKKERSVLKPYMKPLQKKYLSMDDIFLFHDGYPDLLKDDKDSGIKAYAVREEMLRSWDELFEMERKRFSFFDELFAQGYILDSLEIPWDPDNTLLLVAVDHQDLRANLDFGRAVFKTKNIYTGEFKDKHFDGVGRYQWIDGTLYQGHFKKGIMHGHGKIEWEDGSLYEGEFIEGSRAGWGIYSTMQGYTYMGAWHKGLPHGPGKMWYDIQTDNSDYYDGTWVNGIQEGVGTRQYTSGDRYIGQFAGGIRNGKGTMIWLKERQVYKGRWLNGVPHGLGTHIWYLSRTNSSSFPARHIYKGQWSEGKRDGIGKMIYPCGSVYEGRWKDGQRFAKGLFVNPAGELLVGLFRAGSVCGGTEVPLHAPPYECDYTALVDWINMKFSLDEVEKTDQKLHKLVTKHLELFRKLYKRAGQLGQSWGNNGLFPSWLKKGHHFEERDEHDMIFVDDPPHMRGKEKKPHNPDNVYPVFRFGLWLLIKDISGLLDCVTMAHYDNYWSECDSLSFQTRHNPFEPVYLWQFLQCLIVISVSYYVDETNRKYKLRTILEERRRKLIEAKERPHRKPVSSSVSDNEVKEQAIDPCLQYMRDHNLLEDEEEFEDMEEEEDEDEEMAEVLSTQFVEEVKDVQGEPKDNDDKDSSLDSRRTSVMTELGKPFLEEEDGEGFSDPEKEYGESQPAVPEPNVEDEKDDIDDDADDYSSVSSTQDMQSLGSDEEDEIPMTIISAFEKLINEKLEKVVKRPPGKHLPKVPDPLPSLSDLYASFKAVNKTDVITGAEFLHQTVPHDMFPTTEQVIYWNRSKELLSHNVDLDSLFENFDTTVIHNDNEEEPNTLGEEFLGSTINTAEPFMPKMKSEAEPEFERSHKTAVEILNTERQNTVFNQPQQGDNSTELEEILRREKFSIVRDPDEMFAEGNPFDDEDLAKEPFLYTQTKTCDKVQRKPFSNKFLGAHDVTKVFRRLYPKLAGAHHKSNIPSKMVFCDWLWCMSLCARISADREYLAVINDHHTLRPRLFHSAPHIGIHSHKEIEDKWKHPSVKLNSLYYLGLKKELQDVK